VDERVQETFTNPDLAEYTIKVPPPLVQKYKPPSQREYVVHQRDPLHPNITYPSRMLKQKQQEKDEVQIQNFWQMFKQLHINITLADALILMPKYQKMLKALLSNKEKLQELANIPLNENCSAVILKKLLEKLGDPGKFLIPCGFSLPELISTHMTLELDNRAICTPAGITSDLFVLVGKFTFLAGFVIVDYESDPRAPLILGRPFLRSARALIDIHGEEMILRDEGCNVLSEKLLDLNSTKDLHPPLHDNPLSGITTYFSSSNPLLEEFVDELPLKYDDNIQFDIESDLKEIEFLLYQDKILVSRIRLIKRILKLSSMLKMFMMILSTPRTTNLRNEISNFQQRFDESFHEAWDRYKDLLRSCPHHGFTKLYQLDSFYNALNPADQDSLNAAAGGSLLERRTQDVLTIIKNKSRVRNSRRKSVVSQVKACDVNSNSSLEIAKLTHAVNQQTSAVTTTMTAMLKQFQATLPPAFVKAVEETCVTCGGAHPYYQCLTTGDNTFPELRDNIQGYALAAAINYNQGNPGYRPLCMANQIRPPGFAQQNVQNNQNRFGPPQGFNHGNNFNHEQSYQALA
nr:hypothetical protein [Tanacetum cinerariifolium]